MEFSVNSLKAGCGASSIGSANTIVANFIQTVLTAYCQVANYPTWPQDYGVDYLKHGPEVFDFIIVGAGAAGPVIAGRLAENPNYKVLLIEAGDDPPVESETPGLFVGLYYNKYDWNYVTKSNNKSCLIFPNQAVAWPRGKMLGGSTSSNAMIFIRGNSFDFNEWERLGNPTWGWNHVIDFFKKTEDYGLPNPYHEHGVGGLLHIERATSLQNIKDIVFQAAVESGYDYVDDFREGHLLGYGKLNLLVRNGTRNSPAKAFLRGDQPNLRVIKNAYVRKVNFNQNGRATSVSFVYTDKNHNSHELFARTSKEVILCAGAVESPKILMLSGIGPQQHLHSMGIPTISDLAVGENLQDHVLVYQFFKYDSDEGESIVDSTYNFYIHRRGDFSACNMIDTSGFLDVRNESGIYPSIQVLHLWFPKASSIVKGLLPDNLVEIAEKLLGHHGILATSLVLSKPKSRGYIKLGSTDYRQQPIIYPNYLSHDDDVRLLIEAIRAVQKLENTPTFRRKRIKSIPILLPQCIHFLYGSDAYWECYIRQTTYMIFHPVGSVKMGPDTDPSAVVDHRLRVKGVKGLRVADASIMPTITSVNTMAPTVMIGEKAADFIKEEWITC